MSALEDRILSTVGSARTTQNTDKSLRSAAGDSREALGPLKLGKDSMRTIEGVRVRDIKETGRAAGTLRTGLFKGRDYSLSENLASSHWSKTYLN